MTRELLESARKHHSAGELRQAEALYRQVLAIEPRNAEALHQLGMLAALAGHVDAAAQFIGRAIEIDPGNPDFHGNLGNVFYRLGRIADAETAYRAGIAVDPANFKLHNNLGIVLACQRKFADAVEAYGKALALRPDYVESSANLGIALSDQGKHDEAIACFRSVIAQRPTMAEAFNNLSTSLLEMGRADEALSAANEALRIRPDYPEALNNRGNALRRQFLLEEAAQSYEAALALSPQRPDFRNNYAICLHDLGRCEEAIAQYRMAIQAGPDLLDPRLNLGKLFQVLGRMDEAIAEFRAAIRACLNEAGAYNNLGVALLDLGRVGEAIDAFHSALEREPECAEAHCNLANALSSQGRFDESMREYREAIRLKPTYAQGHSNLLLSKHFDDRWTPGEMFAAHLEWARQHAEPLIDEARQFSNSRDPERRLRIGYVSADLRDHPVGRFMLPLLEHRDRSRFEVTCYCGNTLRGRIAPVLKSLADTWRSTSAMTDEILAETIRRDGIDILVDLAGHTANHRLLVFARKPAPIQVTYLGYPDTTGMRAIDYRIVDAISDPPGVSDELHSERLLRVDGPFLRYQDPRGITITPSPFDRNGYVTFGSFNNLAKISPRAMRTRARLLDAVTRSRLLIKALVSGDEATRSILRDALSKNGIDIDRVNIISPLGGFVDHLNAYGDVDIALDTFPYNGTTTTCEALASGVPVIAVAGATHAARMGMSLLYHVGLPELVARDEDECLHIAANLASDGTRLCDLRQRLGEQMAKSPLGDGAGVTRPIEKAFHEIWRRYCAG